MNDNAFICVTSCYKCNRQIEVEYYNDNFETEENVTFLGRLGTRTYSYCPYCGTRESGFSPYDPEQKMDLSLEDDPVESEFDDLEEHSWWPDAEGVTLIDAEEEENDALESEDESDRIAFICHSCGQKFRLNPKGCDKIYCYFCGKEAKEG